ncbi:MAG TPA: hypothetical protein VGC42_00080, partial [Kofleriaceae bacterium]
MRRVALISVFAAVAGGLSLPVQARPDPGPLRIGGAEITIELAGRFDRSPAELTAYVATAARAVTGYFGKFPVARYRVRLESADGAGVQGGTTWGWGGAHSRVILGAHVTAAQLEHDWTMTHEMVHTAFPDQPDTHTWIQEGTATYIEPLARSWVGNYPPDKVWADLVDGVPKGLPGAGDRGLDHTHSWGRSYWGGALFWLLADVEIRERTGGKRGLIDAMRAIVAAGGSNEVDWPIDKAFAIGDKATGVPVLAELY